MTLPFGKEHAIPDFQSNFSTTKSVSSSNEECELGWRGVWGCRVGGTSDLELDCLEVAWLVFCAFSFAQGVCCFADVLIHFVVCEEAFAGLEYLLR